MLSAFHPIYAAARFWLEAFSYHTCQYQLPSLGWRMEPPSLVVSETDENHLPGKDTTPLWQLAESGDLERVKMALAAGAEVMK